MRALYVSGGAGFALRESRYRTRSSFVPFQMNGVLAVLSFVGAFM